MKCKLIYNNEYIIIFILDSNLGDGAYVGSKQILKK